MPISTTQPLDWPDWLRRWDAMQMLYLAEREARFNIMLDVLDALLPTEFFALDLACGPGAISQRLLTRFPKARAVAVDLDPLLLALGQGAIGTQNGRLRWVEADIAAEDLAKRLAAGPFDAVLSTTALHWLSAEQLVRLYRQLGDLVRPGGVFLNGDHLKFGPDLPAFQELGKALHAHDVTHGTGETWEQWWEAVANEPRFGELLAERTRRFPAQTATPAFHHRQQHVHRH